MSEAPERSTPPMGAGRASRREYAARMHRVVQYIDQHLDQPLDLDTLAQVAHFSPFHFHRLFTAWMGETLGDYLRRRRLEIAAARLRQQPRLSVLQAALGVGFGSGEAFTRAFRGRFGQSPTQWRAQWTRSELGTMRKIDQVNRNFDQTAQPIRCDDLGLFPASAGPPSWSQEPDVMPITNTTSHETAPPVPLNVRIVDRAPVTVACLRRVGPYDTGIGRFWAETVVPWLAAQGLLGAARYGIGLNDPHITAPQQCRYDACVEVPADFVVQEPAWLSTLPGGRYAVHHFCGRSDTISTVWTALLRDWLPQSGFQFDARPCFEFYPPTARFNAGTGEFECQICIPVVPL